MQENLLKKYNMSAEELNFGIEFLAKRIHPLPIKITVALFDLLTMGDIPEEETKI